MKLTKRQIASLKVLKKMQWPATPMMADPENAALIHADLVEVVKTDEREYTVARITDLGRRTLSRNLCAAVAR